MRILGKTDVASRRAHRDIHLLRNESGNWRSFLRLLPSGVTVPLCSSPDKNGTQIKTEMALRAMQRAVEAVHGAGRFQLAKLKKDSVPSINWKPFTRIDVVGPDESPVVYWNAVAA